MKWPFTHESNVKYLCCCMGQFSELLATFCRGANPVVSIVFVITINPCHFQCENVGIKSKFHAHAHGLSHLIIIKSQNICITRPPPIHLNSESFFVMKSSFWKQRMSVIPEEITNFRSAIRLRH